MKVDQSIIDEIQENQLTWYGHVDRLGNDRLPKVIKKGHLLKKDIQEDPR